MRKSKSGLEEILKKTSQLMAEKGYEGTSMRELAQAAGWSPAGLYHYFRDKEELLYLINQRGFSTLLEKTQMVLAEELKPDERLRRFIENHVTYFIQHRDEGRVMMFGTRNLDARRGKEIRNLKSKYADAGHEVVRHLLGIKPNSQEVSRKTYLLFGMMNWLMGWYSPKQHGRPMELVNEIFRIFLSGAQARASGEAV